ncbi:MAG: hypothetical protein K2N76_02365 [Muribaculaceae bacterium]|nr:hypothetical protein [Muribaculaceae bacterium]
MPKRNNISARVSEAVRATRALLGSSRGKDILLFLLFVCVSYVFWLIQTLNEDAQKEVQVPLKIEGVPDGITFISDVPQTLLVSVRDRGTSLFNYTWSGVPTLSIPFKEMNAKSGASRVTIPGNEMSSRVRSLFGQQAQVLSVRPDSLNLVYTDKPGRRVKVTPNLKITPSWQSVSSGPVQVEPDSVTVYSVANMSGGFDRISTVELNLDDVSETYTGRLRLKVPAGARAVPDEVPVTAPVEPLIAKQRSVAVKVNGAPADASVVLFPSRVDVTFLVPMSRYNSEVGVITVYADFRHRSPSTAKMPVYLGSAPEICRDVTLAVDSVEYLIEQHGK